MTVNPLLAQFSNEPALVAPEMRDRIEASLNAILQSEQGRKILSAENAGMDDDFWYAPDDWRSCLRPYVVQNGILHIPVKGVLLHNFPWQFGNWATGYDYILRAFLRGCEDYGVRGIALVIDSPGGMVAGCFDAVDKMIAAKQTAKKPVRSFAHEAAYSAAYAIACVGDQIIVSRTGGVGSVGVVTSHLDVSGAMDQLGYKITFIYAGAHKVDGNPYEGLSADVKARIQERIDELYGIFVSSVAANRGLDEQAVRDTEALCFTATQAKSNGFADQIGALDDALAAFAADLSEPSGDEEMSEQKDKPALTQADIDDAVAAANATAAAAQATAVAEAVTGERSRIAAILGSDEAKGREGLANHLAFKTDMSVEDAKAALAESPKAGEEKASGGLKAAMEETGGGTNVGAGADNEDEGGEDSAESTMALVRRAGLACARRPAAQTH
jgi:signal peptide peptidase SppA